MTTKKQGSIDVRAENIFPIIKKFLYNEQDIFVRELVSNAVDATQKRRTLSTLGEVKTIEGDTPIYVNLDALNKKITISDSGIGMTADEVERYINQVAFSGAREFLDTYKDKTDNASMIGHFGLGFYSAFMVAEKVEIETKSAKNVDAPAVRWTCDGSPNYTIEDIEKSALGTDVILYINEESKSFLEAETLKAALTKFCQFLPVPIFFQDKQINNTAPVWVKKPSEVKTEDYQNFYKELYPFAEPPLFWIHLNVDYPFKLTGVLYFPNIKNMQHELRRDGIRLYCAQVYVTDELRGVVPDFLTLLHGVIDAPDIPLNVSRSYLQTDENVRKISRHITKKVADKLEELFNTDRAQWESKWHALEIFVKYGMMSDDNFFDKGQKFLLFADTDKKLFTLDELRAACAAEQSDKDGNLVLLYANETVRSDVYIQAAQAKGYKVLLMDTLIDTPFIGQMESKWEKVRFKRVDSDTLDQLIEKEGAGAASLLNTEEEEKLKKLFEPFATKEADTGAENNTENKAPKKTIKVELKPLSEGELPVVATRDEWHRRMGDMASMNPSMASMYANMAVPINLVINTSSPICKSLLNETDAAKQAEKMRTLTDLALLSQGLLEGKEMTDFIARMAKSVQ